MAFLTEVKHSPLGLVRDFLGIIDVWDIIKKPEVVDNQQLPVCAGNRT